VLEEIPAGRLGTTGASPAWCSGRTWTKETAVPDSVLYRIDGRIATITLNRADQRNAVDPAVAIALEQAMDRVEADDGVWVSVLTGAGTTFCAGADLKAIAAGRTAELATERGGFAGFVHYPRDKPVIAAVRGPALAGGTELVLACDLVVAGSDATFGLPEVSRGIVAAGGGLFRLPRLLPRARALELVLTGDGMGADEAQQLGLINRVVDPDDVLPAAHALAERICRNAPLAVRESLALARRGAQLSDKEAWRLSTEALQRIWQTEDATEGPRAFAEKRLPKWAGR
jgi:enoyl-CoA hydratase/carnithine racemase